MSHNHDYQMERGIWMIVIIPAILAFIFGAWVFYNILIDVSGQGFVNGNSGGNIPSNCFDGCQKVPPP